MIIQTGHYFDVETGKPIFVHQAIENERILIGARGETLSASYWNLRDFIEYECESRKLS